MCWFNLLSNWKHLPHNSQLYLASLCEYECLSNEDCVEKYLWQSGHWTMPWSLRWCVFNSLILENVLTQSLHLIFCLLAGVGISLLGVIVPSVPTCNVVRLRTVCSCKESRALAFSCVLPVDDAEKLLKPCFLLTGFVTKVFAVFIRVLAWSISLSVAKVSDCDCDGSSRGNSSFSWR